ncbi:MAG TPA: energy transducer TonB [Pyrinomonadaceae bacterium]
MNAKRIVCTLFVLSVAGAAYAQTPTPSPSPSPSPKECTVPSAHPVDVRVRILAKPEPQFSKRDRERYSREVIRLRAMFCGSGKVTDVVVTRGVTPEMNAAAIDAAHLIRFTPAEKDGKKVSQPMILEYFVSNWPP